MPDLWLPAGADPLTTHRVESWRVAVLTADDVPVADLSGVTGVQVDQAVAATISGGGTLEIDDLSQDVDWLNARVQPWWKATAGERVVTWPLGVFVCSTPRAAYTEWGKSWRVDLLDKLAVLDQDEVDESYSVPAGAVVTDVVTAVIVSAGETAVAVTASTQTLASGMVWPAGTSKLRIVNDLLAVINYFSLRCDGSGRYVAAPYLAPAQRPVARQFVPGSDAIHVPEFTREQDLTGVPNKVVLISPGSSSAEALVGVATNTDPASRFSYPSRGRWIVHTEQGVEATSQEVLDQLAARRLVELSSVSATLTVAHAMVPAELNEVVRYAAGDVDTLASTQKTSVTFGVGALMTRTIREVVS